MKDMIIYIKDVFRILIDKIKKVILCYIIVKILNRENKINFFEIVWSKIFIIEGKNFFYGEVG